ncbi:MAG: PEGA domain-containing protein [Candidatus Manganitrophaceae bacterium]|nr:MAG: PEGA domain-containing protein [Candidatus Manganitrophaceae bacterium]
MKSLGRYEILLEIGRGAMGIVYLGSDAKIHRQVALKCLRPELFEASEETRKRFQQEILALGRLIHPNIVTIFDAGEDAATRTAYIVMEYVEGTSLGQLLKKGTPLSIDQVTRIGIDICRALDFAHSKGVIHRDIKPGNILLTSELGTIKVTDFGIARLDEGGQTQTDHLLGTPQYMSPEQCKGEKVDGRSDLFSVGALLYELLTRQKPFPGENVAAIMHQVLSKTPAPPATLSPDIPKPLSDLVMKALEKEPGQRFQSGAEMADALSSVSSHREPARPVGEERPTLALSGSQDEIPPTPAAQRRRWAWIPVAVAAAAILGWWSFKPRTEPTVAPTSETKTVAPVPMGKVDLTSTPTGAEISINGEPKGPTPLRLDLPAGSHELVAKMKGHHPLEATISVASGETVPLNLKLTEEESAP